MFSKTYLPTVGKGPDSKGNYGIFTPSYWPRPRGQLMEDSNGPATITLTPNSVIPATSNALQFDGVNQHLSASLDLSSYSVLTISLWVWWNTWANDGASAVEHGSIDHNTSFQFQPNDTTAAISVYIAVNIAGAQHYFGDYYTRPSAAAWHHYLAFYDRATPLVKLYIDGVAQTSISNFHEAVAFGNFSNDVIELMYEPSTHFNYSAGRVDDFAIFSGDQTASASSIYNGANPESVPGIIHHWPIDGAGAAERNIIGNTVLLRWNSPTVVTGVQTDTVTGDLAQFVDSSTALLTLTPSGTDTYTPGAAGYTDIGTESLLLTPSGVDIAQDVESATEYLTLTPSTSDIELYVDATTARVSFTPGPLTFGPNVPILYPGNVTENPISDGGKWDSPAQVGDNVLKADGTSIYSANAGMFASAFRKDQFWANGEMRVDSPQGGGTAHYMGLRIQPSTIGGANNSYMLFWPADVGERFDIYKVVAGATTLLGYFDIPHNINGGEPVYFGANGSSIYVRVEENYLGSVTDTTYPDAGYVSISTSRDAAVGFKNFGAGALNDITGYIDTGLPLLTLTPSGPDVYTSGGTAYTDTATESLLLTPSAADIAQDVDAQTIGFKLTPSSTDVAAFVDSNTPLVGLTPSSADIAAFVDAQTGQVGLVPSSVDISAFVDQSTGIISLVPSATDIAAFIDQNTEALLLTPSSTDIAAFVDASTEYVTLTPSATQEGIVHSDAATDTLNLTPSSTDIASYVDGGILGLLTTPSSSDILGGIDSNIVSINATPSSTDIAAFVDATTETLSITPSSADIATDIDANSLSLLLSVSAGDIAVYVDSNTGLVTITPGQAQEGIEHTDATTGLVTFVPSSADIAVYIDVNVEYIVITGSATEVLGGDVGVDYLLLVPSTTDVAAYVDSNTATANLTASSTDISADIDSNTSTIFLVPSYTDTAVYVDSNTGLLLFTITFSETAQYVDSSTLPLLILPSGTDQLVSGVQDAATEYLGLIPSATDIAQYTDSNTVGYTTIPIATEFSTYTDTQTSTVALSPSSTDIAAYTETNTANVVISPSTSEVALYTDSATPVVALRPSGFDTATYVDTSVGLIHFTGADVLDAAEIYVKFIISSTELTFIAITLVGTAWRHFAVEATRHFTVSGYRHFTVEATKG